MVIKYPRATKWLVVAAILTLQTNAQAIGSQGSSRINITFVKCGKESTDPSAFRFYVLDAATSRHVEPESGYKLERTVLGVEVHMKLNPGFYDVGVIGQNCSDETLLPVLPSRDQRILLLGMPGLMLRESSNMIAGTVPFSGYTASIAYWPQDQNGDGPKSLTIVPARVEGDSYYATGLPLGTARLRVGTADGASWLEIKIGRITDDRRNIVFNVTEDQIEAAFHRPERVTPKPRKATR